MNGSSYIDSLLLGLNYSMSEDTGEPIRRTSIIRWTVEEEKTTEQESGIRIEEIIDEEIVRDLNKAVEFKEEGNRCGFRTGNEL